MLKGLTLHLVENKGLLVSKPQMNEDERGLEISLIRVHRRSSAAKKLTTSAALPGSASRTPWFLGWPVSRRPDPLGRSPHCMRPASARHRPCIWPAVVFSSFVPASTFCLALKGSPTPKFVGRLRHKLHQTLSAFGGNRAGPVAGLLVDHRTDQIGLHALLLLSSVSINWSSSAVAMGSQGGGMKRDAIPSTQGTVKKEPGAAGLPVIEVTCFSTDARCCSMELAHRRVYRIRGRRDGLAHISLQNTPPRAKIHLILSFYRPSLESLNRPRGIVELRGTKCRCYGQLYATNPEWPGHGRSRNGGDRAAGPPRRALP